MTGPLDLMTRHNRIYRSIVVFSDGANRHRRWFLWRLDGVQGSTGVLHHQFPCN